MPAAKAAARKTDVGFIAITNAQDGLTDCEGTFFTTKKDALKHLEDWLNEEAGNRAWGDPDEEDVHLFRIAPGGEIHCVSIDVERTGFSVK